MTNHSVHLGNVPDSDEAGALLSWSPIVSSNLVNVRDGLKQTYGNFVLSTTSFPELTLPLETSVSGAQFPDFAGLTNVVVVAKIGSAAAPALPFNRIVNSGIYRVPAPQLMPGTLYDIPRADKIARKICALRDRLRQLQSFSQGWDANKGETFTAETLASVSKVIDLFLTQCVVNSVVPCVLLGPLPDGSLRFECKKDNKELFITVLGESITLQRWQPLDAVESEGYWDTTLEGVQPQIEWLLT
jgi:hypothetical protein